MRKLWALIVARNKEFYRDRTTLAWTLLFPFIVLLGFAYGYSGRQEPILRVTVVPFSALDAPALRSFRTLPGIQALGADDEAAALKKLERFQSDLVLSMSGKKIQYSRNKDSEKGLLAETLLVDSVAKFSGEKPELLMRSLTGHPLRYADWVLPGLLAMNIMFGSMFGVGYVIVRYRKNGVLKRFRATPLSAFQFLAAQAFSRVLLMVFTSILVVVGAMLLIGFRPQGSWIDFVLFLAVSSMSMISLSLVVAARLASEEVAEGVLNLMTWPMIFLSGVWFSIDGASRWVLYAAKLMPLTYVVEGLRAILLDGVSITRLVPQITVLTCLSAFFIVLGSLIFRWR